MFFCWNAAASCRAKPTTGMSSKVFRERKYSPFEIWKDRAGKNFRPSSWYNIGGSTKFFGTVMMRLRASDFEAVEHAEGMSPAWPFSYGELEPYYIEAEHLFGIHGDPSLDPWEPPRSGPLPYPAVGSEPYVARVEERLRAKGLHPFPLPVAVDLHPGGKCVRCGTCDGFPCAVGGKNDAETRCVEPALKTGRVTLWTGAFVRRLLLAEDGRTINAVEVEHEGQTKTVVGRALRALRRRGELRAHSDALRDRLRSRTAWRTVQTWWAVTT